MNGVKRKVFKVIDKVSICMTDGLREKGRESRESSSLSPVCHSFSAIGFENVVT